MTHEERLLRAVGNLEEVYLLEAWEYQKKHRRLRRGLILAAAVAAVMATGVTVLAASSSWQETVRSWFGVEETGVSGYTEYSGEAVEFDGLRIQQISRVCSGEELVAFFEVTPLEGDMLDLGTGLEVQVMDEVTLVTEGVLDACVQEYVSKSDTDALLKVQMTFLDMSRVGEVSLRFYHPDAGGTSEFSESVSLDLTDTPMLEAKPEIPLRNETADADGMLQAIHIGCGSLELYVAYEITETWCTRTCVSDGGEAFCKAYYGPDWESKGVREEPAHFSREDEIAIFQAYGESWDAEVERAAATVVVTLKDGTTLELSGEPGQRSRSTMESVTAGYDVAVYRYTILPLVELEDIVSVEILGQSVETLLLPGAE